MTSLIPDLMWWVTFYLSAFSNLISKKMFTMAGYRFQLGRVVRFNHILHTSPINCTTTLNISLYWQTEVGCLVLLVCLLLNTDISGPTCMRSTYHQAVQWVGWLCWRCFWCWCPGWWWWNRSSSQYHSALLWPSTGYLWPVTQTNVHRPSWWSLETRWLTSDRTELGKIEITVWA